MNKQQRFDIRFDPGAGKEYQRLDKSVVKIINKAIDELEYRADEIGKPLGNIKNSKLAGCKEIKLRDIGIRIIFIVTNRVVNILRIVYILAIEQRANEHVFKIAHKRLKQINENSFPELKNFEEKSIKRK